MAKEDSPRVLALVNDLLFAARLRGTAEAAGSSIRVVTERAALDQALEEASVRLLILDLDHRKVDVPRAIAEFKQRTDAPILAFGSHTNAEAIVAARSAGADRVLARSSFFRELPELLGGRRGEA